MSTPQNNGYKVFTLLIEYSTLTGLPTGRQKPNVPGDPNYIEPVFDTVACPPGTGAFVMNILVIIADGFSADISLTFGLARLTTNVSGTWIVPVRTYDGVIFGVTVAPEAYVCRITYNSGLTKTALMAVAANLLIPGPYAGITKIEIFPSILGDFNDNYNNDYNT